MTESENQDVTQRLAAVKEEIASAARVAGRNVADIHLVAVSKVHPASRIRPALTAGHRLFGENKVQEAEAKWPALRQEFPDLRLHLIGPLQTNKVRKALHVFDVIETVDREKLARQIARIAAEEGLSPSVFVQVNTGEEPQKAGINPADCVDFVKFCQTDCGLEVRGLMCIPPVDEEAALHFALLRELARDAGVTGLSMGMSADFEKAIAYGATHVRVGTAIFGDRPPPALD